MSTKKQTSNLSALRPGTELQMGKYRIEQSIASGGFGNTYKAVHTRLGQTIAIKEFFIKDIAYREANRTTVSVGNESNKQQFDSQRLKFNKEARRLFILENPHIVRVSDLFDENGTSYYVMDYIDGESLAQQVNTKGKLSEARALDYMEQVLTALEETHSKGIWHLDLKPSNLMIDRSGKVVIIDFGASKQTSPTGVASATAICYTPGYAPTEQMEQNLKKIGPWSDIYALGATIYFALTAQKPPSPSAIAEEGMGALHLPEEVSTRTKELIAWMMSNRLTRPQSASQVIAYLHEGEEKPSPVAATPIPQPTPAAGQTDDSDYSDEGVTIIQQAGPADVSTQFMQPRPQAPVPPQPRNAAPPKPRSPKTSQINKWVIAALSVAVGALLIIMLVLAFRGCDSQPASSQDSDTELREEQSNASEADKADNKEESETIQQSSEKKEEADKAEDKEEKEAAVKPEKSQKQRDAQSTKSSRKAKEKKGQQKKERKNAQSSDDSFMPHIPI